MNRAPTVSMSKRNLKRTRLDRFIAHHALISMREVQLLLAKNVIRVNGVYPESKQQKVSQFDLIEINGQPLLQIQPCYLMLNKPAGVVSATEDTQFQTVLDLVPDELCENKETLHYAGRLDRASTGLMLLTNDSEWSRALAEPSKKQQKHYSVEVEKPLKPDDVEAFSKGFFFEYEQQWTQPAQLEIISPNEAKVIICEGKYHQIKRMFAKCDNRVVSLHRYQIGEIVLDKTLPAGGIRSLTLEEIMSIGNCPD